MGDYSADTLYKSAGKAVGRGAPLGPHLAGLAVFAIAVEHGRQLLQGATVNLAFEEDHFPGRMPVVHPPPAVELGLAAGVQLDRILLADEAQ